MMSLSAEERFRSLLSWNAGPEDRQPSLTAATAARLLERTRNVPFFAHSYSFYHNMIDGFTPFDLARFAYEHDLHGICLHISDGDSMNVRGMAPRDRDSFRALLEQLGLHLHLEISSTDRQEVETVIECARSLDVQNIRLYARHEGPLGKVLDNVYNDLAYACERANQYDLCFDYEQHEDLKAAEIASILARLNDRRMNALFDFSNSLNAYEDPLSALHVLAPYIRQAHVKGARRIVDGDGWGQLGVPQGCTEDELPGVRMLHDLLLLGDVGSPQVICFALEQEVDYYAPAFRRRNEPAEPVIQFREPSATPVDPTKARDRLLADERRWAIQQIAWNRSVIAKLRQLAHEVLAGNPECDLPSVACLPQASFGNAG